MAKTNKPKAKKVHPVCPFTWGDRVRFNRQPFTVEGWVQRSPQNRVGLVDGNGKIVWADQSKVKGSD